MSQGQLKKEFTKKDVTRMRNLITGKSGDKTQIQSGYEKKEEDHKEGDIWQDSSGKSWTIKNGIKRTATRLNNLKKLIIMPLSCPKCTKHMKINDLNKKMYATQGVCFDCVIEQEHQIRISGDWENYTSQQMTANKNESLKDFEQALESWYKEKDDFFTENGDIENWSTGDKKKAYEEVKQKIEELKNIKL
jgi:hypothetical protein